MKLLAFGDTHNHSLSKLRQVVQTEHVDIAACVGDFTVFGNDAKKMMHELDTLGCPVVLIHGNHEDEEEIAHLASKSENLHFVHGKVVTVKGLAFFGFGGGGFKSREPALERFTRDLPINAKTVVLSHSPPYGTTLDEVEPEWHVGNQSLRDLIVKKRPMLVLAGHIHECFHAHDTLSGATLINPGPDGELIEVNLD